MSRHHSYQWSAGTFFNGRGWRCLTRSLRTVTSENLPIVATAHRSTALVTLAAYIRKAFGTIFSVRGSCIGDWFFLLQFTIERDFRMTRNLILWSHFHSIDIERTETLLQKLHFFFLDPSRTRAHKRISIEAMHIWKL